MRGAAWPVPGRPEDRNPSLRCPLLLVRIELPFNRFPADFSAHRDLGIAVLRRDLGNELRQRGNLGGPMQFDVPLSGGFNLERIAFLQLGFLNYRLGNTHRQAIAPSNHLRFHEYSLFSSDT